MLASRTASPRSNAALAATMSASAGFCANDGDASIAPMASAAAIRVTWRMSGARMAFIVGERAAMHNLGTVVRARRLRESLQTPMLKSRRESYSETAARRQGVIFHGTAEIRRAAGRCRHGQRKRLGHAETR